MALEAANMDYGTLEEMERRLKSAKMPLNPLIMVLSMLAQYIRDTNDQGVEPARQIDFLDKQENISVF